MPLPRLSRSISPLVTAAAAVLLAVPLLAGTAQATEPGPGTATNAAAPVTRQLPADTTNACPRTVKPGYATCLAIRRTDVPAHRGTFASPTGPATARAGVTVPAGYGPADLQGAYVLPSAAAGPGKTVAIVDAFDDPSAEADLAVYRAQYGLPPCTTANGCFRKVAQDGSTHYPATDAGWATEESLDLDMVSAICRNCAILLVETNDNFTNNLGAGVNEAVALGAKYVSNSYGGQETDPAETTWDAQWYRHPGVVVTASSGDNGEGVEFPAASPYVTAVGGTTLTRDASSARGWAESAWLGAGSGCSSFEAKPSWQTDTGCANRTVADVSADADPATGVAVYNTSLGASGWQVFGGTSVAAPIIASAYALAGNPVSGTYPSSYPYAHPAALNDVTSGANGLCPGQPYFCDAGPGYDGPTGLGTPAGVAAFGGGPAGDITGTVTAGGQPLADATVTAGSASVTTDPAGHYDLTLPPGSYTITATAFGYTSNTVAGVAVGTGQVGSENLTLAQEPVAFVSGTVTDGSGAGWPLYAKVSVPGANTFGYTNPKTGVYNLTVPANSTFTIATDPVYPGYQEAQRSVTTGGAGGTTTVNVAATVDVLACTAPGYLPTHNGSTQTFDASTAPAAWSVVNAAGTTKGWAFDNPGGQDDNTGGSGNFAVAYANGNPENTQLVSPVLDLGQDNTPVVQFNSDLNGFDGLRGDPPDVDRVDVSIDGGQTWTTAWQSVGSAGQRGPDLETVQLPTAAGRPNVRVRFTYTTVGGNWWQIDNVFVGNLACVPRSGALVEGTVTAGPAALDDATVTAAVDPGHPAITGPVPDGVPADGFYVLFDPAGNTNITAAKPGYVSQTRVGSVPVGTVATRNFVLAAGRVGVTSSAVTATVARGGTATRLVTFTNTGNAPTTVQLAQIPWSGAGPAARPAGAPLQRIRATVNPLAQRPMARPPNPGAAPSRPAAAPQPAITPWVTLPNYPAAVSSNAAATDPATGMVYSVGGSDSTFNAFNGAYAYNPATRQWTALPAMPSGRTGAVAAFITGKLYVTGGFGIGGAEIPETEIYDPATRAWSAGASMPHPLDTSAAAVLNGQLYVIGGCDVKGCGFADVQVYHPSANAWSTAPSYPTPIAGEACGAIAGTIDCAGGALRDLSATSAAFSYQPALGTWSPVTPLPDAVYGSAYAEANGELLLSGGIDGSSGVTNQGEAYSPITNVWTALPNADNAQEFGAGACGFTVIAGTGSTGSTLPQAEQLPGFGNCTDTVPWLSESNNRFTLAPGQHVTITIAIDAGDPSVTASGTYTAGILVNTDNPYPIGPINVTMNVT